jgi:hypothetical protein
MSQQHQVLRTYTEGDVYLAVQDLQNKQVKSLRRAEELYSVPQRTIQQQRDRKRPRRNCEPNSKRLTKLEEEAIVERILEQSLRGLPPSKPNVQDIADRLLRKRNAKPVGKHWVDNFIKRTPEIQTQWTRPYNRQRAACEDPAVIQPWFTLVQSIKAKYSIIDEDMYNFNKSGFLIGKISSQLVVTGLEKPRKQKKLQPGDRK